VNGELQWSLLIAKHYVTILFEAPRRKTKINLSHHNRSRFDPMIWMENRFVVVHVGGLRLSLWTAATSEPLFRPSDGTWVWTATVEWYWQGKTEELVKKPDSRVTLPATSPTCTDPVANPVLYGERTPTNYLSHCTAKGGMLSATPQSSLVNCFLGRSSGLLKLLPQNCPRWTFDVIGWVKRSWLITENLEMVGNKRHYYI
jgi:hypothetical protein